MTPEERLAQIEKAEDFLRTLGLVEFRARLRGVGREQEVHRLSEQLVEAGEDAHDEQVVDLGALKQIVEKVVVAGVVVVVGGLMVMVGGCVTTPTVFVVPGDVETTGIDVAGSVARVRHAETPVSIGAPEAKNRVATKD